jgi:hypothetical protein
MDATEIDEQAFHVGSQRMETATGQSHKDRGQTFNRDIDSVARSSKSLGRHLAKVLRDHSEVVCGPGYPHAVETRDQRLEALTDGCSS